MRLSFSKIVGILVLAGIVLAIGGCGSASNNDQGMSFTLIGFSKSGGSGDDSGQILPLGTDQESSGTPSVQGALTFYGVQNNLSNQGVRVDRAFLDFYVDGATMQPPQTTVPMGFVLGPVASTTAGGSLPPSWSTIANVKWYQQFVVPPDVMAWLNLNRNSLPELPFQMTVHVRVTGVTTAGDRLETNTLDYPVDFVPDQIIPPTGGTGDGGAGSTGAVEGGETSSTPSDTGSVSSAGSGL
jgi:hypothetical protein